MRFHSLFGSQAKSRLLTGARILMWTLPLLVVGYAFAQADGSGVGDSLNTIGVGLFGQAQVVLRAVLALLVVVIGGILGFITLLCTNFLQNALLNGQNSLILSDTIGEVWQILLSGSNVLFFLALTIFAIMIITGSQNYNLKKAISAIVYAFIAANLSFEIVHLFVNLGDALQEGIRQAFIQLGSLDGLVGDEGSLLDSNLGDPVVRVFDFFRSSVASPQILNNFFTGGSAGSEETIRVLVLSIGFIVSQAVTAYVAIRLCIVLFERAIRLAMLIVFAPLTFVLQLFPGAGLDKLAQNWWGDLIKWVLVLPTAYLLMGIAGVLLPTDPSRIAEKFAAVVGVGVGDIVVDTNIYTDPMLIIASLAILFAAGNATGLLKLGSEGLNMIGKPFDKFLGDYGKYARTVAGGAFNKAQIRASKGEAVFNESGRLGQLGAAGNKLVSGNKVGQGLAKAGVWLRTRGAERDRLMEEYSEAGKKQKAELLADVDWKQDRANQDEQLRLAVQEGTKRGDLEPNATKYDFLNLNEDTKSKLFKEVLKKNPLLGDRLNRGIVRTAKANETQAEKDFKSSKAISVVDSELEGSLTALVPYLEGKEAFSSDTEAALNKVGANMLLLDEYIQKGTQDQKDRARDLKNQFLTRKYGREVFEISARRQPYYILERRATGEADTHEIKRLAEVEVKLTDPKYQDGNIASTRAPLERAVMSQRPDSALIKTLEASSPDVVRLLITDSDDENRTKRLAALEEYESSMSSIDPKLQTANLNRLKRVSKEIGLAHNQSIRDIGWGPQKGKKERLDSRISDLVPEVAATEEGRAIIASTANLLAHDIPLPQHTSSRRLSREIQPLQAILFADDGQGPAEPALQNYAQLVEEKGQLESDSNKLRREIREDYGERDLLTTKINELRKSNPALASTLFVEKPKQERSRYFAAIHNNGKPLEDNIVKQGRVVGDIYKSQTDIDEYKAYAGELWDNVGEETIKAMVPYVATKEQFQTKLKGVDLHKILSIIQD